MFPPGLTVALSYNAEILFAQTQQCAAGMTGANRQIVTHLVLGICFFWLIIFLPVELLR